jgi:malto-oligosyltrehalose trehalohydrolase
MNQLALDTVRAEPGTPAASAGRGRFVHNMRFGAQRLSSGETRFRLWAPACDAIAVALEGAADPLPMQRSNDGWHELVTREAGASALYRFILPDGTRIPDPASRFQPQDVHGPSEVIDPCAYAWQALGWAGRPWNEAIVYELHVGTFTPEGRFSSAIRRLDHLAALGVTAIEIMPIADFAGNRNWGYDGVLFYAPDSSYGRPEDLKALIDAAHARGIMVLLDVVYNHFGPDGNYLSLYAPDFLTDRHQTPWGAAVNYDGAASGPVREFVVENALYWLEEYRFDGLRLDAVHAIIDDSPKHLLEEIAERVRERTAGRHVHLLLENEHNEARRLDRESAGTYTAQWNDDVHHALHCAVTHERHGYYGDYVGDAAKLGRALAEGFAFQGEHMQHSDKARGEPSAHLPPAAFVAFIQNHDQVGNRAFGERLGMLVDERPLHAIASIYLLLPQVPMLFMGEEWNAQQPFPFFCHFSGELGKLVTEGRRREFAAFPEFQDPQTRERIPDPESETTFRSAKLDWSAIDREPHGAWLSFYRDMLKTRRREIVPRIPLISRAGTFEIVAPGAVMVRWQCGREYLVLEANLTNSAVSDYDCAGRAIWLEGNNPAPGTLDAWTVRWSIDESA